MPCNLDLPEEFKTQGWKIKIREKERTEPPHVSVMMKEKTWRRGLREKLFLDKKPPARLVPAALKDFLQKLS
jgi:hypothetical protein